MIKGSAIPVNVPAYIKPFPPAVRTRLEALRKTIKTNAADAEEVISYQMPGYKYFGMLVYFAGYKNHIGFYPGASGIENFKKELSDYKGAKGSVQFPHDEPLPLTLIAKIVKFRVKENKEKNTVKSMIKTTKEPIRKKALKK